MEHTTFNILKNKYTCFTLVLCIALSQTGCRDFIEVDLKDKNLTVLAPSHNLTTTNATVNFYWEELDGATGYRMQIVKPSFDSMQIVLRDTLVSGTTYTHIFSPGTYQWRVRAENGNTFTPYVTRTLTIDSTGDLSGQSIILLSPINDYAINSTSINVNWYGLYNATNYRIAVKTHAAGFGGSLVVPEVTTTDTFVTISGLPEGYLDWGVRGESSLSASSYSTRSIYIDLTAPATPTLNAPVNGLTLSGPNFTFDWIHASDSGSPLKDSVFIYNNAALTDVRKSYYVSGTTLTDTIAVGTYYWRIKTIDKAGNKSAFTPSRSFTVN